jgi:hypothetical protein
VLNTIAVFLLSPILLLSLRHMTVAFRERSELATQRSVRWATIALGVTALIALGELGLVFLDRSRELPAERALWEGLRAAKNLCAPPLGVSGALLYLSRMLRNAVRAAHR